MIGSPADHLRARLERREWVVTVEVVAPAPADAEARARILTLADAVRDDDRIAALTLTDRTAPPDGDPLALAPGVAARSARAPLVHVAGKGRDLDDVERTLGRAVDAGVRSVLLTGGDPLPPVGEIERSEAMARAWRSPGARAESSGVSPGARDSFDAIAMLRLARDRAPDLLRLAVLAPAPGRPLEAAWERAAAKRDAGAAAMIAQVTWDPALLEGVGAWQARLGVPILGAVMPLTRGRLDFLARHRITGIVVPPALRRRVESEAPDAARRRLALDLVLLRRLGYAGAHVSGFVTPSRVAAVLDEAMRLHGTLGDEWRQVWREAVGIA